MSGRTTSFLDWMGANGFRRFGEFGATGLHMAEALRDGSVYLFVLSGSLLYAGETGQPLRTRMTGLCKWMRDDPGALAARFRAASADRSEIWARPERLVPTLDGEAPDRFAVEWLVIRRWCPPLNRRGALRPSAQAPDDPGSGQEGGRFAALDQAGARGRGRARAPRRRGAD